MALLEVVNKQDDFKKNTTQITMLDTEFSTLGKVIGSDPGKDWTTLAPLDILSKDALVSLNTTQQAVASRWDSFKADWNAWQDTLPSGTGTTPISFALDIGDWADGYIGEVDPVNNTPASYQQVLNDIATAERKIREIPLENSEAHFSSNRNALFEWSKDREYGSNIGDCRSGNFESRSNTGSTWMTDFDVDVPGITVRWENPSNGQKYNRIVIENFYDLEIGQTVNVTGHYRNSRYEPTAVSELYFRVTRTALGVATDDGRYTFVNHSYKNIEGNPNTDIRAVNGADTVNLRDTGSPHFNSDDLSLPWFKQRIMI